MLKQQKLTCFVPNIKNVLVLHYCQVFFGLYYLNGISSYSLLVYVFFIDDCDPFSLNLYEVQGLYLNSQIFMSIHYLLMSYFCSLITDQLSDLRFYFDMLFFHFNFSFLSTISAPLWLYSKLYIFFHPQEFQNLFGNTDKIYSCLNA